MDERLSPVRSAGWSKALDAFNRSYVAVTAAMSADEQRTTIAQNYATLADELKHYGDGWSSIDPYQIADWAGVLTWVEFGAWQDIRSAGLPLWPRLPVGDLVVSFGNPAAKVAFRCGDDGDSQRVVNWLAQTGWRVFHATAAQCTCVMDSPADVREKTGEVSDEYRARYLTETLEGTIQELRQALIAMGANL